ncbi:hypothetical protein VTO42DRAFT_6102 [Malbranchea cinnamomea]
MAPEPSLSFTLLPEALLQLHDVLICLSKFDESVSVEAENDFLRFSALNSTKSAYAAFKFDATTSFFSEYAFTPRRAASSSVPKVGREKFSCQIYIKALLSVFKGRASDFMRDKDTAVERCVVEVFDGPDEPQCRFVIQMICRHGVVKKYKLTYEVVEIQHALFDKSKAQNQWTIESRFLREIIDHFGSTSELLDIYTESNKVIFTSYTQKVTDGREILKQPVHTSVAIDTRDFDQFHVEERLHVAISVKDFKAIILHADTLKSTIVARYTRPCRPLQLSYQHDGMACEFTMMTRGDADDEAEAPSNGNVRELSARPYSRPPPSAPAGPDAASDEPPPPVQDPAPAAVSHPPPQVAQPIVRESVPQPLSASFDPLFVPADDDRQWDEPNYEYDEDILGWDVHNDQEPTRMTVGGTVQDTAPTTAAGGRGTENVIPPTQRISQIRGLFD